MESKKRRAIARIVAWIIAVGLVVLVIVVPVAGIILFLLCCAVMFFIKWGAQGKWAAMKDAAWTLLTGW